MGGGKQLFWLKVILVIVFFKESFFHFFFTIVTIATTITTVITYTTVTTVTMVTTITTITSKFLLPFDTSDRQTDSYTIAKHSE